MALFCQLRDEICREGVLKKGLCYAALEGLWWADDPADFVARRKNAGTGQL